MSIYLILHKVRGEPAFDIAERCGMCKELCQSICGLWPKCQNEEWWIIPTSGHTAHPVQTWPLETVPHEGQAHIGINGAFIGTMSAIPDGWPDHYQVSSERAVAKKGTGLNLMDFIKLPPPKVKLRRRI